MRHRFHSQRNSQTTRRLELGNKEHIFTCIFGASIMRTHYAATWPALPRQASGSCSVREYDREHTSRRLAHHWHFRSDTAPSPMRPDPPPHRRATPVRTTHAGVVRRERGGSRAGRWEGAERARVRVWAARRGCRRRRRADTRPSYRCAGSRSTGRRIRSRGHPSTSRRYPCRRRLAHHAARGGCC